MLQQLAVHGLEQGRDAIDAQALLVVPDGVAAGMVALPSSRQKHW